MATLGGITLCMAPDLMGDVALVDLSGRGTRNNDANRIRYFPFSLLIYFCSRSRAWCNRFF